MHCSCSRGLPDSELRHVGFSPIILHQVPVFDPLSYKWAHLAAAAAESVTAHGIVGKCALFTAGSSATGALLQPQMENKPSAHFQNTAYSKSWHGVRLGTHHLGSTITLFPRLHEAIPTLWRVQQLMETHRDIYQHLFI